MIDLDILGTAYDLAANTGTHYLIITYKVSDIFDAEINLINRLGHISEGKFKDARLLIEELKKLPVYGIKYVTNPLIYYDSTDI